jgi:hypothetical protein
MSDFKQIQRVNQQKNNSFSVFDSNVPQSAREIQKFGK